MDLWDYSGPTPSRSRSGVRQVRAGYAAAAARSVALSSEFHPPRWRRRSWMGRARRRSPRALAPLAPHGRGGSTGRWCGVRWSEHTDRCFVPSWSWALGVPKQVVDSLGLCHVAAFVFTRSHISVRRRGQEAVAEGVRKGLQGGDSIVDSTEIIGVSLYVNDKGFPLKDLGFRRAAFVHTGLWSRPFGGRCRRYARIGIVCFDVRSL